jgi:hypothetical protein
MLYQCPNLPALHGLETGVIPNNKTGKIPSEHFFLMDDTSHVETR